VFVTCIPWSRGRTRAEAQQALAGSACCSSEHELAGSVCCSSEHELAGSARCSSEHERRVRTLQCAECPRRNGAAHALGTWQVAPVVFTPLRLSANNACLPVCPAGAGQAARMGPGLPGCAAGCCPLAERRAQGRNPCAAGTDGCAGGLRKAVQRQGWVTCAATKDGVQCGQVGTRKAVQQQHSAALSSCLVYGVCGHRTGASWKLEGASVGG